MSVWAWAGCDAWCTHWTRSFRRRLARRATRLLRVDELRRLSVAGNGAGCAASVIAGSQRDAVHHRATRAGMERSRDDDAVRVHRHAPLPGEFIRVSVLSVSADRVFARE